MNVLPNVIFDLDDFAEQPERNCMKELLFLKEKFPDFKVTLFAIPFYDDKNQSTYFNGIKDKYGEWIQLAVHGWNHSSNFEFKETDYMQAQFLIDDAYKMGCFVKGFKAPGWQISRSTYFALRKLGFWVADHKVSAYTEPGVPNKLRRPRGLKVYEIDHPWMIHGHTWNCVGNGIQELIERWEKEGYPFDQRSKFHFIDDYLRSI